MKKTIGGMAAQGKRPSFSKKLKMRKFTDNRGAVAIIVALSLPFLVLSIGGGADYARILAARSKLQAALDSATLATYKHYAQDPTRTEAQLKPYFDRVLKASLQQRFETQLEILDEQLELDAAHSTLRAHVTANFPTTFLKLAGINPVKIGTTSEVKAGLNYTEVALVLDVTASMNENGKLAELKRAATKFLDKVNEKLSGTSAENFKVAIVPFAEYVNVGTDKRNAPWIQVDDDVTVTGEYEECTRTCDNPQTRPACRWEGNPDIGMREVCDGTEQYCPDGPGTREECHMETDTLEVRWEGCVGSRDYPYNMQDGGYDSVKVPGVMTYPRNPDYPANTYEGWHVWPGNDCPQQPITPLTPLKNNLATLKQKINSLRADGFTYIPIGLAWGWRVLSNNGPEDPFNEGADNATVRQKGVRKIIILMTDGKNRMAPNYNRDGWSYRDHSWRCDGDEPSCSASEYADERLAELCRNIRATNPETGKPYADIITVTFNVSDPHIKTLLRDCASLGSFDATSGQLTTVFENIASNLAELHISR